MGADLRLVGTDCLEAELAARAAAAAAGAVYVSPYNDPWVMAGQGTLALELLAERRRGGLDVVLVPVGGGGLIGGVASVLKAADPAIRVSIGGGKRIRLIGGSTELAPGGRGLVGRGDEQANPTQLGLERIEKYLAQSLPPSFFSLNGER